MVLLEKNVYCTEVLFQLQDVSFYKPINRDPMVKVSRLIKIVIDEAKFMGYTDKHLVKFLYRPSWTMEYFPMSNEIKNVIFSILASYSGHPWLTD